MQEQSYGPETLLRVGVSGGGCSGFSYALGFDKQFDEKADSKLISRRECRGRQKSDLYLDGTTVDFYEGLEKRGFTFETPTPSRPAAAAVRSRLDRRRSAGDRNSAA